MFGLSLSELILLISAVLILFPASYLLMRIAHRKGKNRWFYLFLGFIPYLNFYCIVWLASFADKENIKKVLMKNLILIAICFFALSILWMARYTIFPIEGKGIYKLDRFTGKIYLVYSLETFIVDDTPQTLN